MSYISKKINTQKTAKFAAHTSRASMASPRCRRQALGWCSQVFENCWTKSTPLPTHSRKGHTSPALASRVAGALATTPN